MKIDFYDMSLTYSDIGLQPRVKSSIQSRSLPITSLSGRSNKVNLRFPLAAAPMDTVCDATMATELGMLGGVGFIHRFMSVEDQAKELREALKMIVSHKHFYTIKHLKPAKLTMSDGTIIDFNNNFINIGVAVGVGDGQRDRLTKLVNTFEYFNTIENIKLWICYDTANGYTEMMEDMLLYHKKNISSEHVVVAGNIASAEAFEFLHNLGVVDVARVGISSGSPCTTGVVTGVGAGMVSVIRDCVLAAKRINSDVMIMADGGIKTSGDIAKALAVGAHMVMVGSMLAGFFESPGKILFDDSTFFDVVAANNEYTNDQYDKPSSGLLQYFMRNHSDKIYKTYRGMASPAATKISNELNGVNKLIIPEGVEHFVPYKGYLKPFFDAEIAGGVRSAMTYFNASTLEEFRRCFEDVDQIVILSDKSYQEKKPFIKENGISL